MLVIEHELLNFVSKFSLKLFNWLVLFFLFFKSIDVKGSDFLREKRTKLWEKRNYKNIIRATKLIFNSLPTLSSNSNSIREAQLDSVRYSEGARLNFSPLLVLLFCSPAFFCLKVWGLLLSSMVEVIFLFVLEKNKTFLEICISHSIAAS